MRSLNRKTMVITILSFTMLLYMYSIQEIHFFADDYHARYILNAFTGLILLIGVAYLCYPPQKPGDIEKLRSLPSQVLRKYKLESGAESTEPQYFISDKEAWNVLRKQLRTISLGYAVLYVYENCELAMINNSTSSDERRIDCWKPVCMGRISEDFERQRQ
ncbi:hypothetical protein [uncultured Parabacteroides sp.]|uniref:hypothetical protein n=1 Tax=uncultured Parabacteroides sp. TaxID=512312 RepID=UPI002607BFE6|nr:hypothetical protein [uncultured Parabacteroides sp.]